MFSISVSPIISHNGQFKFNMNELCKKSSRALYPLLGNVSKFYAGSIKILIELFDQNASIITIPCGDINKARIILKPQYISNPSKI